MHSLNITRYIHIGIVLGATASMLNGLSNAKDHCKSKTNAKSTLLPTNTKRAIMSWRVWNFNWNCERKKTNGSSSKKRISKILF